MASLTAQQLRAVECLIHREPGENLNQVAERAGCTRMSLWRWMKKPEFVDALRKGIDDVLGIHRGKVAKALVSGATSPGQGQAAMQKLYWQRLGELSERFDHGFPEGPPRVIVELVDAPDGDE